MISNSDSLRDFVSFCLSFNIDVVQVFIYMYGGTSVTAHLIIVDMTYILESSW